MICIISNQKGIDENVKRKNAFMGRIEKTAKELTKYCAQNGIDGVPPFIVMAATETDVYRKPRPGMWHLFKSNVLDLFSSPNDDDDNVIVELEFYVGDAAGRMKDHADTDYKWALNLKTPFYVPEQIFAESIVEKYKTDLSFHVLPITLPQLKFDPASYLDSKKPVLNFSEFDMLLCVGPPAAGKSHFCKTFLTSRTVINQDTLRTLPKCINAALDALRKGQKIVIDNTNPTKDTRQMWIQNVKSEYPSLKIGAIHFTADDYLVQHNDGYREFSGALKEMLDIPGPVFFDAKHVPGVAYHSFFKKFQIPTLDEGFDGVTKVDFYIDFTFNPSDESLWSYYYH